MRYRCLTLSLIVICFLGIFAQTINTQEKKSGQINWVEGYISAVGEGTATPSGNKLKDQLRALRAATLMAQRSLLETVKGVRIDSQTKVENKMVQDDVINTRIEGTIRGAEIVKQNLRWEGDIPIATAELRICLSGLGGCKFEKSIINVLDLDQKSEQTNAPGQRLNDIAITRETIIPKVQDIFYDSSKPVTGVIFNLRGLFFERVILPIVITIGDGNKSFTVYSVKSVEPQVIRTFGVVRYADTTEQARQNPHLGDNAMVIPVEGVTKEDMIIIGFNAARIVRETISHGNDYFRNAKVCIAAK
ncbi:MAG: LPP20 family lipoprotein [Thermodesulfobacteriota bacterium]